MWPHCSLPFTTANSSLPLTGMVRSLRSTARGIDGWAAGIRSYLYPSRMAHLRENQSHSFMASFQTQEGRRAPDAWGELPARPTDLLVCHMQATESTGVLI